MTRLAASLVAPLLLAGCPPFIWPDDHFDDSGDVAEVPDDTGYIEDTDRPHDTDPGGEDTAVQNEYPEPYGILLAAEIAWAPDRGEFTSWVVPESADGPESTRDPYLRIELFGQSPEPGTPGDHLCGFTLQLFELPAVDGDGNPDHTGGLGDGAVHLGVQFWPTEGLIVDDSCRDVLDPDVWGSTDSDFLARLGGQKWGMGVTGVLGESELEAVQQIAAERGDAWSNYEGSVIGARPWLESTGTLHDDGFEFYFARAVATTSTEAGPRLQFDDTDSDGVRDANEAWTWIPRDQVMSDAPPAGVYIVEPIIIVGFGVPLRYVLMGQGAR